MFLTTFWLLAGHAAAWGASFELQGQSKGSTAWVSGNLQNWQELDLIPCRVYITGGPLNNQRITIDFPHLNGTTPGFEDLKNFTTSPNASIVSGPTLIVAASGTWSYTLTVTVSNGAPAYVQFLARLAAGSHLNTGSSLMLSGHPSSMGNLQIHKPAPAAGVPDLALVKTGPATAAPGSTITYTLSYTNKADGTNTAKGVQICDILPEGIIPDTNQLGGGTLYGNTIFWDLGDIAPGGAGQKIFQVVVDPADPNGMVLTNFAQILSSENEANYADNASTVTTTVVIACVPPRIESGPSSVTNCPGTTATFSVSVNGTAPFTYQWRKGGSEIPGATNSVYSIGSVSAANAGAYDVVVRNACGVTNSAAALLMVNTPVSATPLVSQTNCPGTTVIFGTTASGSGPFSYQWLKGTTPLGQTGATLTLNNISATDAGIYSVIVSGACGSVTNSATLTVNIPVSATPLVNQTNCPGTTAIFSTTASGTGPFSYQWLKGTTPLGQTGATLTLNNVSAADAGIYSVIVSGACGSVTNNATLAVSVEVSAPFLFSPTNCPGDTVSFSSPASGTGPFHYQWFKAGDMLTGETNSSLVLTNINASSQGVYSVIISGACGSLTNSGFMAVSTPPTASSLTDQTNCPGTTATFSTTASGTGPFSYQWLKGQSVVSGQTDSSLTLNNVSATDAGIYSVIVSGACGSVTNSATLTVSTPVSATPLVSQTNCPGTTVIFSTTASGTGPFGYQWLKGTIPLGQSGATLTLSNVSATDAGIYSVIVSGACGSVTNSATLTVNTQVSATPLLSQTNCPGTTVIFSTTASGTGPFSYQWLKGTAPLGQTGATLTLNNISAADAGIYSVIVSGACGSVTNSATLTVNTQVSATPLLSQTNCPGTTVIFSTTASGTGPFSYQWLKGQSVVSGQTDSSLTLNNVTAADAGIYSVIVSGACGSVTNSATLTVNTEVSATPLVSQTNCPGTTVIFSTIASGTGPFSYQWLKGTTPLGQTGATLTLNNISAADAGIYSVIVSGACSSVTNSATLTVNTEVSATPLVSQTNCPGTTVIFSTIASGTGPFSYQWLKGTIPLGQTGATLTLNNISATDAGIYSVIVSGACSSVTNSATLTVNTEVSATPLVSQTNCPGTTVIFSTIASGTGPFSYQWLKGQSVLNGQTGPSLTLTNVSTSDSGIYSVIVSGSCATVTNSATLTVNQSTAASPLANLVRNPGETAVFTTTATGTGPFTYVWKKNNVILGETGSSLTLSNISYGDEGTYTVEVSGACNTAAQNGALHVNLPPTVQIVNPTDGSIFIAPASFAVAADAQDTDGSVTNVQFFVAGTNKFGETGIGNPFVTVLTNAPAGTNQLIAIATDNYGLTATSAPISVIVLTEPTLTVTAAVHFNPQTGLFEQGVRVTNPTYSTFEAVRVNIFTHTNAVQVYNASGSNNGIPYVQSSGSVPPGGHVDFVIEYYVTAGGLVPNPTLTAEVLSTGGGVAVVSGTGVHINRGFLQPDGYFVVEFASLTNRLYYIQYSSDLMDWKTAVPAITGNGTWIQWVDNGQPKTESAPPVTPMRFYRVILLP